MSVLTARPANPSTTPERRRVRWTSDLDWTLAAVGLVVVAGVVAAVLQVHGPRFNLGAPPLFAKFYPHVGPGTIPAMVLAVAAAFGAHRIAMRGRWSALMVGGWLSAVAWTTSLALIDGWQRGFAVRLARVNEYLHDLPKIGSVSDFLTGFTSHILDFQTGSWTTHVSAHPPGATLVFVILDRLGLRGGGWAGVVVVLVGSVAAVAVPQLVRSLGAPTAARRLLPFTVFLPAAIWVGVSADGMFAGVVAGGLALVVMGVLGRSRFSLPLSVIGGGLLGLTLYLSYGLVLIGLVVAGAIAASAAVASGRTAGWVRSWLIRWVAAALAVAAVVVAFEIAGFSWFEGLRLLHTRYYQGIASSRPYWYFVWANFAAIAVSAGPAAAAGIARAVVVARRSAPRVRQAGLAGLRVRAETMVPALLTLTALAGMLVAGISGLSKAETERIWLPFVYFLVAGLALLPRRSARWALAVQLVCALLVNHILLTEW